MVAFRKPRWQLARRFNCPRTIVTTILDIDLPLLRLPVAPGRNVALLVELAAKNLLLRARGHDATVTLLSRVEALRSPELKSRA